VSVGPTGRAIRCGRRLDDPVLRAGSALQRLEHRLLRLELVLENEAEDEPATDEDVGSVEIDALEHVERPLAHVCGIRADGRRIQGRELRAVRPLAPERVVDVVVAVGDRARPSDRAKDPELLEASDVRVAPRKRRDAGRYRGDEIVVRDRREQRIGRGARTLERTLDLEARLHTRTVVDAAAVDNEPKGGTR